MGTKRLRKKLKKLFRSRRHVTLEAGQPLPRGTFDEADAIVTHHEVCERHGTGVILRRLFKDPSNLLSIRSGNLYHEHDFGALDLRVAHTDLSRAESFERLLYLLNGNRVARVVCVPFDPHDLVTALVLKELFNAPLCTYVMDDNNVFAHGIDDDLMRETLSKSALRLAISPELRDAYEQKFHLKFFLLPPVVAPEVVRREPGSASTEALASRRGMLIGSLWSREWLQLLCRTVKEAGLTVEWYGNASAKWLKTSREELAAHGILDRGFVAERELIEKLKNCAFALIPTGTLDQRDDRASISRLSLPTRMPFLLAATQTPMLVLGSSRTAAAQFVRRFGVGTVAPYDARQLRAAVDELCLPERQREQRVQAAQHAPVFSAAGLEPWLWRSLESGEPADDRFERLMQRSRGEVIAYLEGPAPQGVVGDLALVFHALRRLKRQGYSPDFVLDVGASSGIWSDLAQQVFPKARFILVDPLFSRYQQDHPWYLQKHPEFELVEAAVSDQAGQAEFEVSDDLYGSSLFRPADFRRYHPIKVAVTTLDALAREKQLSGRGLLKIDVQFTEHLVLAGARELLRQVDALAVELSLVRYAPQARLFLDMCQAIENLGFRYYEDIGGWRCPVEGALLQKDVLFVRQDLFPPYSDPGPGADLRLPGAKGPE